MGQILITITVLGLLFTFCKKSTEIFKPLSPYTVIYATTIVANARANAADHEIFWKTLPATDAMKDEPGAPAIPPGTGQSITILGIHQSFPYLIFNKAAIWYPLCTGPYKKKFPKIWDKWSSAVLYISNDST